jgi:four helix bundle protein
MARTNFEKLEIYRLSERLADLIWDIASAWHHLARDTVGKQLIRASDSIGANIAEGAGRGTYADNRRFALIARGSLYETKHWLRRAFKRRLLTDEQVGLIQPLVDELAPRLNAYQRSMTRSIRSKNDRKARGERTTND